MIRVLLLSLCFLGSAICVESVITIDKESSSISRTSGFLIVKEGKRELMINTSSIILVESAIWGDLSSYTVIHYSVGNREYKIRVNQRSTSYKEIKNMILSK